ncbi:hypothetical protein MNEG_1370 [Monoraphidium neglectum]|uniref:Uncharacterized protein n=1 Tax=Monoraphidium neglectum TaxID=145388 RepID=A0A0D2LJK3_9CHLO|nr:hypothetical protein MNEG_1370 [Monoraphidium neglectum]KIZ06584.1 hypothetical protein MNEG_1370 [Monoraphidium neglectum]|eukprot:XP_013905603.1 hypothetical protein MNEG_1370 [Monoraphidium neglectum]
MSPIAGSACSDEEADSAAEVLLHLAASDGGANSGSLTRKRRHASGTNHKAQPKAPGGHDAVPQRVSCTRAPVNEGVGGGVSSGEEASSSPCCRQVSSGDGGGHESQQRRDKDWAALTTWIRMNLHHPRTAKKLVLFVGRRHPATGAWSFDLDPRLTWDDVSEETKRRLSLLPEEAARTYARKYPHRAPGGWTRRPQKYAAPGGGAGGVVPLGELRRGP